MSRQIADPDYGFSHHPMNVPSGVMKRLGITPDEYKERQAANEKWCTKCKTWHALSAFYSDSSRPDGLSSMCRQTKNQACRERYNKRKINK